MFSALSPTSDWLNKAINMALVAVPADVAERARHRPRHPVAWRLSRWFFGFHA